MDETLVLVSANGLGGTSVVEIEQAAGLSPGSGAFYRHFPSKLAAVKAAVEREASRLRDRRSELAAKRAGDDDSQDGSTGAATELADGPGAKTAGSEKSDGDGSVGTVTAEILDDMRLLEEFDSLLSIALRDAKHLPDTAAEIRHLPARGETPIGFDNIVRASEHTGRDPQAVSAVVMAASVGLHLINQVRDGTGNSLNREQLAEILADMVTSAPTKR